MGLEIHLLGLLALRDTLPSTAAWPHWQAPVSCFPFLICLLAATGCNYDSGCVTRIGHIKDLEITLAVQASTLGSPRLVSPVGECLAQMPV
jgi:hypothetical protein